MAGKRRQAEAGRRQSKGRQRQSAEQQEARKVYRRQAEAAKRHTEDADLQSRGKKGREIQTEVGKYSQEAGKGSVTGKRHGKAGGDKQRQTEGSKKAGRGRQAGKR